MFSNADLRITPCFGFVFKKLIIFFLLQKKKVIFLKTVQGVNLESSTLMENTTHNLKIVYVGSFLVKDAIRGNSTLLQGGIFTIRYGCGNPASPPAMPFPVVTHN